MLLNGVDDVPIPDPGEAKDGGLSFLGVVGADCGMGGNESSKCAPNEDDGLNGLIPEKPVICGFNEGEETDIEGAEDVVEVTVAPVGWLCRNDENVDDEVVEVFCADRGDAPKGVDELDRPATPVLFSPIFKLENDEAMLDISDFSCALLLFSPPKLPKPLVKPVCCACCCCC